MPSFTLKSHLMAQARLMLNNASELPIIGSRYHSASVRRHAVQAMTLALARYDEKAEKAAAIIREARGKNAGFQSELSKMGDGAGKETEMSAFAARTNEEMAAALGAIGKVGFLSKGDGEERTNVILVDDGSESVADLTDEQAGLVRAVFLTDGPDWFASEEQMLEAGGKFGTE